MATLLYSNNQSNRLWEKDEEEEEEAVFLIKKLKTKIKTKPENKKKQVFPPIYYKNAGFEKKCWQIYFILH